MLKNQLAIVLLTLAFALLLAPAASQAAPLGLPHSGGVASLFDQVVHWWDRLAGHTLGRTPAPRAADLSKNGCGIDPNGQPVPCNPGDHPDPGTQVTTPPDDGGGSGS